MISKNSKYISNLFTNISNTYDKVNTLSTFGYVIKWYKFVAIYLSKIYKKDSILLDIGSGSGKAASIYRKYININKNLYLMDISSKMVLKSLDLNKDSIGIVGDCNNIPLLDNTINISLMMFVLRNLSSTKVLNDVYRVLEAEGKLIIVDFFYPKNIIMRIFFSLYMYTYFLLIVILISPSRISSYLYFIKSIKNWNTIENLKDNLEEFGYKNIKIHRIFFILVNMIVAEK